MSWLNAPEVIGWWGDPKEQFRLLENPQMVMRIVSQAGKPFAYAQDYDVRMWSQEHFCDLPLGTRAIDYFIGEPDMVSMGLGSAFVRLLAEQIIAAGAPLIAIDSVVDNLAAQRAYEKAGFHRRGVVRTDEGHAVLMLFKGQPMQDGV
jgi:aminoglycoside 6'-N-acetyltransferase